MSKKNTHQEKRVAPQTANDRKNEFFYLFSREAPHIRDSIVKDLPAYNTLLSLNALSFDEFALQQLSDKRGIPRTQASTLLPDCPKCGTDEAVGSKGTGAYRCRSCGCIFSPNHNSISSGTKCDAITWMKVLQCILNLTSMTKTCEQCDITETTYYKLRNRLFYAMQLMMDEVKLSGIIEVDNTFVRISYKGMNLKDSEFQEDSLFFDDNYKPRTARKRGGSYSFNERNANSVCVFTGIDDRGHVVARFAGIGSTSVRSLKSHIPADKFLLEVPKQDSFLYHPKKKELTPKSKPGDKSIMIADMERAIEGYANFIGIQFEAHVYRANGVQRKLSEGAHHIQRVNALHHRLKDFLRKANYVSTKYLPGYLILFEFLENTKATQEAINRLFQILATPNLGKPSKFYQEMYTVPNYLLEWMDGPNPLQKLPYNKLLSYYLYDHMRRPENYPGANVSMEQITKETGYTAPSIRKFYRDLTAAGYQEKILRYFGEPTKEEIERAAKVKSPKKKFEAPTTVNATVLAIYDEYAQLRKLPKGQRPSLEDFLKKKNEEYGTSYTRTNMLMKFKYIEQHNERTPLPELNHLNRKVGNYHLPDYAFFVLDDYERIVRSYREKGESPPNLDTIYAQLSEKYGVSIGTIGSHITYARAYIKNQKQNNE